MKKQLRILRTCALLIIIALLAASITQIVSMLQTVTWTDETWLKQPEKSTVDPWIKKHWNHVKILSDTVNIMLPSKRILLWTKFFGNHDYIPRLSSLGCPVPKCLVTTDRSYLNQSDAVIFHLRDIDIKDMPKFRIPKQVWILLHHESPPHTPEILNELNGVFNWTATYRFDSEILLTPTAKKLSTEMTDIKNYAKGKRKMIVWFVSNCKTPSNRESFVKQLQKSIPVDVYGSCGPFTCLPKMSDDCYEKVGKIYRFYLSFENSICKDYVTEKFFHVLGNNIIPIVMGGANYSSFAPPHSYIDALSFKTPKHLAHFLLQVAKDEHEYNKYFAWKKTYQITVEHYACQICRKLHEPQNKTKYYNDISNWWFHDANCRKWSEL